MKCDSCHREACYLYALHESGGVVVAWFGRCSHHKIVYDEVKK